ncbi:hypothetical protein HYH03_017364 [Edaphochlamys debaryana]|uniref:Uncharacterized protein n=1 Tax=Edaphochlamys debaryana TaxID=47281 RepID=A0A835XFS9_9CHLO|nr:hypothetical protein HYH03_017364 [Edaphochlamys debaryana]|eukprot:KAG2483767.1 hypothetical protein HYH03_017364 [Edaphochlamys debaryana]
MPDLLYRILPVADAGMFLAMGSWHVNLRLELAFQVCAAAAVAVLHSWYRDLPHTDYSLAWILSVRLLVATVTMNVGRWLGGSSSGGRSTHSSQGLATEAQARLRPNSCAGGSRKSGDCSPADGAQAGPSGSTSTASTDGLSSELGPAQAHPGVATEAATREQQRMQSMELPSHLSEAHKPPLYRSHHWRTVAKVKIPWLEPEDLPPDFRERLADLVGADGSGRRLAGLCVRRGCVDLTLMMLQLRDEGTGEERGIAVDRVRRMTERMLAAMGLERPPGAEPLEIQILQPTGTLQWRPAGSGSESVGPAIALQLQVTQLEPRVLLLPQTSATPAASQDALKAAAHSSWPQRLRARVSCTGASLCTAPEARVIACLGDALLPAQLVSARLYDSTLAEYDIELLEAPPGPGPVLLHLDFESGAESLRLALPTVLVVASPAVATELEGVVLKWPPGAEAVLDDLLFDLGAYMSGAGAGSVRGKGPGRAEGQGRGLGAEESKLLRAVGEGLAAYAQAARLPETAACLAALHSGPSGGGPLAEGAPVSSAVVRRGRGRSPLLLALGLRSDTPAEEAAFRGFHDSWAVALARTGVLVDTLLLLFSLARGRREGQPILSLTNVPVYAAFSVSTALALARLLLPRPAWERLALRTRVARYCGTLMSKTTFLLLRPPVPATAAAYVDVGMLLLDGVVQPGTCLVTPLVAALVACVKLPMQAAAALASGNASSLLTALVGAACVELAALGTTVVCQAYLRSRFACGRAAGAAAGGGADGSRAHSKQE